MPQPSVQPAPNWGNTHAHDCPLTKGRIELWTEFCESISIACPGTDDLPLRGVASQVRMNHRDQLWGCVIEYAAGGDEDREQCDCTTWNTPEESQAMRKAEADYRRTRPIPKAPA